LFFPMVFQVFDDFGQFERMNGFIFYIIKQAKQNH
jgi:hypothetical protein